MRSYGWSTVAGCFQMHGPDRRRDCSYPDVQRAESRVPYARILLPPFEQVSGGPRRDPENACDPGKTFSPSILEVSYDSKIYTSETIIQGS
jgi:hypothetical protein